MICMWKKYGVMSDSTRMMSKPKTTSAHISRDFMKKTESGRKAKMTGPVYTATSTHMITSAMNCQSSRKNLSMMGDRSLVPERLQLFQHPRAALPRIVAHHLHLLPPGLLIQWFAPSRGMASHLRRQQFHEVLQCRATFLR